MLKMTFFLFLFLHFLHGTEFITTFKEKLATLWGSNSKAFFIERFIRTLLTTTICSEKKKTLDLEMKDNSDRTLMLRDKSFKSLRRFETPERCINLEEASTIEVDSKKNNYNKDEGRKV